MKIVSMFAGGKYDTNLYFDTNHTAKFVQSNLQRNK